MAQAFSKAGPTLGKTLRELLAFIATATLGAVGHALAPKDMVDKMSKYEPTLIETSGSPDPTGNIAVKATAAGLAAAGMSVGATGDAGTTNAVLVPKQAFVLEKGFIPPPIQRGGGVAREETYPFSQMSIGDSFFVASTEDNPNPAKALASTLSSATKRFASFFPATVGSGDKKKAHPKAGQQTGKDGRKFTVRGVAAGVNGEKANGARVYRVS